VKEERGPAKRVLRASPGYIARVLVFDHKRGKREKRTAGPLVSFLSSLFSRLFLLAGAAFASGIALADLPRHDYVADAPGTYALQRIQPAGNGWVLEGNLLPRRLSSYTHGAITLLSFVYTYCTDPVGCPLAYSAFVQVRERVSEDPALRGKVELVSLSFDPTNDTPEAMLRYGGKHATDTTVPWHFLTTYSVRFLLPILEDFGQDVELDRDAEGKPMRTYTHMLKVFLIDADANVREIYSTAFLNPEVIFNDIKTLALEAAHPAKAVQ
jgi:protein SCO1/2